MKRAFESRTQSEILRRRFLAALGLPAFAVVNVAACAGAERDYVTAPMAPTVLDAGPDGNNIDIDEAGADAAHHATRALHEPVNRPGCTRSVRCRPEDDDAPVLAYPEPFSRCTVTFQKNDRESAFSPKETLEARKGEESTCCYVEFKDCKRTVHVVPGRALRVASGAMVSTPTTQSRGFLSRKKITPQIPDDPAERARLALTWTRAAAAEHASIAVFSRVALTLMAFGANSDLVTRCHRAALDEVRHAEDAYALASAFAGEALGPGALHEASLPIAHDLVLLARETFVDGCIGETAATLVAARERDETDDPSIKHVLNRVAHDEASHAELAFLILAFTLDHGGADVARAIEHDLNALDDHAVHSLDPDRAAALAIAAPIVRDLLQRHSRSGS